MNVLNALLISIQPLLIFYIQVVCIAVIFIMVVISYEKVSGACTRKFKHRSSH